MAPEKNASMVEDNHVDIGRNKVIQDIARAVAAGTVLFGSGACGVVSLTDSEGGGNKPIITSPGIPTKDQETNTDPTLANYELTPTPETTETMISEPNSIELDLDSIVFPPIGYAKEAYEKGEYEDGLRNINQWVSVWDRMGFFNESIKVDQLKPVVLDGSARIVCVASKDDQYTKTLYCPPIDMEQGGLKGIPELGFEQELDKPLVINFEGTEELITRGKDKNLVYQFVDKYQKKSIKYVDAKTGEIKEGDCGVEEIELPEIVLESMNQVPELSFNMEFKDPKAAYRMLLDRIVGDNLENQQFWLETLGISNPTTDQLLAFARNNVGGPDNKQYWLPFTTYAGKKYNFVSVMGYQTDLRMTKPDIDGVYIDGMYSMFFYPGDMKDFVKSDYFLRLKKENVQISMGLISAILDGRVASEFGLLFENNRFVFISGAEHEKVGLPEYYYYDLGGPEQIFRPDVDPAIVSAQFLSYMDAVANYNPRVNSGTKGQVCTNSSIDCPGGIFSGDLNQGDWVVKIND